MVTDRVTASVEILTNLTFQAGIAWPTFACKVLSSMPNITTSYGARSMTRISHALWNTYQQSHLQSFTNTKWLKGISLARTIDFNFLTFFLVLSRFVCFCFIAALHGMQRRSSNENSVCPSVRHTRGLWQNGRKICPDFYAIWKHI